VMCQVLQCQEIVCYSCSCSFRGCNVCVKIFKHVISDNMYSRLSRGVVVIRKAIFSGSVNSIFQNLK
jgi:hypothetical protein